jgi:uncharacterized protein YrrD
MLKSTAAIKDLTIHASDGEIGSVEDLYFDDETWAIRYLIVNTGSWLSSKLVLISPIFIKRADWATSQIHITLTRKQIENSPDIDTRRPVSRQYEADYMDYYGSSYYWGSGNMWGSGMYPTALARREFPYTRTDADHLQWADSHLRSCKEVTGYNIEATDGEIGHVQDFIVDQYSWSVRYLEVKTRNWLPGKVVLISPEWIENVQWAGSKVRVGVNRETIKTTQEFIESVPITREYESQLHEHYGRPPYWLREPAHA